MSKTTHKHTIVLLLFWNLSGTTRVSRYQKGKTGKGKTNLDLLEQEIVSDLQLNADHSIFSSAASGTVIGWLFLVSWAIYSGLLKWRSRLAWSATNPTLHLTPCGFSKMNSCWLYRRCFIQSCTGSAGSLGLGCGLHWGVSVLGLGFRLVVVVRLA